MFKRILMPTDGSACSDLAIQKGLVLAKALDADVTFLYALEDPFTTIYAAEVAAYQPELYESMKKAAQGALESAKALADEAGVRASVALVERTHPVKAIHSAEKDADLVVMGTHGRRGFNRLMFGSVAEGALRRSKKPYLMVRSEEPSTEEDNEEA